MVAQCLEHHSPSSNRFNLQFMGNILQYCDIRATHGIQHKCKGKEKTESQFCFGLFSQLPVLDLLNLLHADSKVVWGKLNLHSVSYW